LKTTRITTKMFWVVMISFQLLDQLPLLIRLLKCFWYLPKKLFGKIKNIKSLDWPLKVDDQNFLIAQFSDKKIGWLNFFDYIDVTTNVISMRHRNFDNPNPNKLAWIVQKEKTIFFQNKFHLKHSHSKNNILKNCTHI
jgi:hypothetical protein